MPAVDTNVLVRLITRDDPKQTRAAEAFVARGAWVSHLVLVETTWVLDAVYGLKAHAIAAAIDMLINHAQLTVQDRPTVAAALHLYQDRPTLGFSDCLILETARKSGHTPLGTFDRKLGAVDGAQRL